MIPKVDFDYQKTIYVAINNTIEDLSDNLIESRYSIFSTQEDELKGPSIISLSPPDNSTDVNKDPILVVKFDENIELLDAKY